MVGRRFPKQTVRDIDVYRKTVLVRTDYNVPLMRNGAISDDLRIRASLPTLQYLIEQQCKIVVISHLGRPKKREKRLSLSVVAHHLQTLLGRSVQFVDDCVGDTVRRAVRHATYGSVIMLENLRFYPEEETDDPVFAHAVQRAVQADYFIQDGFGVSHRSHASTHAITLYIPGIAGLLLEKEYVTITQAIHRPRSPFIVLIGGVKVSDKIAVIKRFIPMADRILIGGAMANAFLQYRGYSIGDSVVEPDQGKIIQDIYAVAEEKVGSDQVDNFLVLPRDVAVAESASTTIPRREVLVNKVAQGDMVLDIGSKTIDRFTAIIAAAKTVVWNGPMGYTETDTFSIGSARVALAIAQNKGITSIIGGGDTADFILKWDGHDGQSFSHVSTGGGASMELMAGKKLPGIESLLDVHGLR